MMKRIARILLLAAIASLPTLGHANICSDLFHSSMGHELGENVYVGVFTDTRSGRKALSLGYPIERKSVKENGVDVVYFLLNIGSSNAIRYDSRMLFASVPLERAHALVLDLDDIEKREEERIVTIIAARQVPKMPRFPDSPSRFPLEVANVETEAKRFDDPPEYVARRSDGKLVLVKKVIDWIHP